MGVTPYLYLNEIVKSSSLISDANYKIRVENNFLQMWNIKLSGDVFLEIIRIYKSCIF